MSPQREWAIVWALVTYDVVIEPVIRAARRGWALGIERARTR